MIMMLIIMKWDSDYDGRVDPRKLGRHLGEYSGAVHDWRIHGIVGLGPRDQPIVQNIMQIVLLQAHTIYA
jgi:hypothetical protein